MKDTYPENIYEPKWLWGDKINERLFYKEFLEIHPMICINGTFFTADGRVTDENKLKKEILKWIEPYVETGIPKKITNLLDTMRVLAYSEPLPTYTDRIFLANGTYYLSCSILHNCLCRNRVKKNRIRKNTPKTHSSAGTSIPVCLYPRLFFRRSQRHKSPKITPKHDTKTEGGVQCPEWHKGGNGNYPCF